jgi:hypothetical protein
LLVSPFRKVVYSSREVVDKPFHSKQPAGRLAIASDFTACSGGPSSREMIARNAPGAVDGMSFFRPVMSGVLYRGNISLFALKEPDYLERVDLETRPKRIVTPQATLRRMDLAR